MRILIVTDAWFPQVNGVVRTLHTVKQTLEEKGDTVYTLTPDQFRTIGCPTYPEIHLALFPGAKVRRRIRQLNPNAIHIATEGPLGLAARNYCVRNKIPFTTSFHTRFPEYVKARFGMPVKWGYRFLKWFHNAGEGVMVATASLRDELQSYGFINVRDWTRGIDTALFRPRVKNLYEFPRPVSLYVGRVAVEKNIEAFLSLKLKGSKVVVGDGPQLEELKRRYPDVHFLGVKHGEALAKHYACADVFVFPSKTDTFGLVMLEALASGIPVAAYPVPGPLDVIGNASVGALKDDLAQAVSEALEINPADCRQYALNFSWSRCAELFRGNLAPIQ